MTRGMTGLSAKKIFNWALVIVWLAALVAGLASISRRTNVAAVKSWELVESPPFSELSPAFVDVVSLGHKGIIDDALLLHTLNYLMDPKLKQASVNDVVEAMKATTRLKPKIETIYMFGCLVIALDLKKPEACEPIIVEGINLFPDGWRLPVTLGTILYHSLKDEARAAIFYELASSKPYAPHFTKSFAAKLRNRSHLDANDVEALIQSLGPVLGEKAVRDFYMNQEPAEVQK